MTKLKQPQTDPYDRRTLRTKQNDDMEFLVAASEGGPDAGWLFDQRTHANGQTS